MRPPTRQRLSSGLAVGLIAVVFKSFVAPSVAQMVNQGEVDSNRINHLARQEEVAKEGTKASATLESIERLTQILTKYEANPHLRHEIVLGMEEPRRSRFLKMLKRIRYPLPGESNEVLWPEVYGPSADPRGAASPLITIQETKNQEQRERERAYNAEAKEDFLRRRILARQAEPFELSEQEQERERERAAERQRLRELRFRARVGENTRDLTTLGQVEVRKTASTAPEHRNSCLSTVSCQKPCRACAQAFILCKCRKKLD